MELPHDRIKNLFGDAIRVINELEQSWGLESPNAEFEFAPQADGHLDGVLHHLVGIIKYRGMQFDLSCTPDDESNRYPAQCTVSLPIADTRTLPTDDPQSLYNLLVSLESGVTLSFWPSENGPINTIAFDAVEGTFAVATNAIDLARALISTVQRLESSKALVEDEDRFDHWSEVISWNETDE